MVQLLKIKEHIYRFIGKYEIYTIAVFRFLVAFVAFTLINQKIGYMDLLQEYPAVVCIAVFFFTFRNDAVFGGSSDLAELLCIIIGVVRDRSIDLCVFFLHLFPLFQ